MKRLILFLFVSIALISSHAKTYYCMYIAGYDGSITMGESAADFTISGNSVDFPYVLARKTAYYSYTDSYGNKIYISEESEGYPRFKFQVTIDPTAKHIRVDAFVNGDMANFTFYTESISERDQFVAQNRGSERPGNLSIPSSNTYNTYESSSSSSTTVKSTCPKCGGRKWRSDNHQYQVNADDYHHHGGSGCPYCTNQTAHWHSHCNYCGPDGTISTRR